MHCMLTELKTVNDKDKRLKREQDCVEHSIVRFFGRVLTRTFQELNK
jgi:hypothetical protein